jgi:hypothetical protein
MAQVVEDLPDSEFKPQYQKKKGNLLTKHITSLTRISYPVAITIALTIPHNVTACLRWFLLFLIMLS